MPGCSTSYMFVASEADKFDPCRTFSLRNFHGRAGVCALLPIDGTVILERFCKAESSCLVPETFAKSITLNTLLD